MGLLEVVSSPPVRWGLLDFMSALDLLPPPPPSPPPVVLLNCDPVSSVWRAGPQPRSCEFSVACWTPTAILRVQCGVPDRNCDPASSVWRAGPQLWSREFSAVCRTSTATPRVQCGVPDLNCDYASSVWRAGPHLWWKGLVVVAERVCQRSSCKMSQDKIECQKICLQEVQKECVRKNGQKYVRNVRRYCYVWKKFKENVHSWKGCISPRQM